MNDKHSVKGWSEADRRYGWKIGSEGWKTVKEAAPVLGYTVQYVYELLAMDDKQEPSSKAYPLRAVQDPVHKRRMRICARSIREFNELRKPVEV